MRTLLKALAFGLLWQFISSQEIGSCSLRTAVQYIVQGDAQIQLTVSDVTETRVRLLSQVSVETGIRSRLTVINLRITAEDEKVIGIPSSINKPVVFDPQDRPSLENMTIEEGESRLSVSIKKAIINLLPPQVGQLRTHLQIKDMLNLLEEGKDNILFNDEYKDLVLVLGNTGSGKSTFTQWMSGKNNTLQSTEIPGGDFMIHDELNKISNETIESKTIFPDLVVDSNSNTVYYDLPGFSDTRSSSNDLASSFFTTRVIEHAKSVKLVFIVNYSSVRKGVDRKDFILLLQHATELLKNINKYKDSIVLVVTKVENKYRKRVLISDESVTDGIADFLKEVRKVLITRQMKELDTLYAQKVIFFSKALDLLDVFLTQNNGSYSRIALFRRPEDSGPIDEMEVLNLERQNIKTLLEQHLIYTDVDNSDFGRTIADSSKNEISNLVESVENNILQSICEITERINNYFDDKKGLLNTTLDSIDVEQTNIADLKLSNSTQLAQLFAEKNNVIQDLVEKIKVVDTLDQVPRLINDSMHLLDANISPRLLSALLNEGHYLKFLTSSTDKELNTRMSSLAWASEFQKVLTDLVSYQGKINIEITELTNKINKYILDSIQKIGDDLKQKYYVIEEEISDIFEVHKEMNDKYEQLTAALDSRSAETFMTLAEDIFSHENITVKYDVMEIIVRYEKHQVILKDNLKNVRKYLNDTIIWHIFLGNLLNDLSIYQIQNNVTECYSLSENISYLEEGKQVDATAIEPFLERCFSSANDQLLAHIKQIKMDKAKLYHLKELLTLVLGDAIHTCEEGGKMTVKGFSVTTEDVMSKVCPGSVKLIEVFALDTIILNHDIDETGKQIQLAIVAPNWIVRDNRLINLDGLPGKPHIPPKAESGHYPEVNGHDGKPGNPGGTGGTFLGIGDRFENTEQLKISSNGGKGGNGQAGGDGGRGKDGDTGFMNNPEEYLLRKGIYNDESKYSCHIWGCDYVPVIESTCSNGGNSGRKGAPGVGGLPGEIDIISTSQDDLDIETFKNQGYDGVSGDTGRAEYSGYPGDEAIVKWRWLKFWNPFSTSYEQQGSCSKGSVSWSNNYNGIMQPSKAQPMNRTLIIEDYKKFVKGINSVVETKTREFFDKVSSYEKVANNVDPTTYVVEIENNRLFDKVLSYNKAPDDVIPTDSVIEAEITEIFDKDSFNNYHY